MAPNRKKTLSHEDQICAQPTLGVLKSTELYEKKKAFTSCPVPWDCILSRNKEGPDPLRTNMDSVVFPRVFNQLPQTSKKMPHHTCRQLKWRILFTVHFFNAISWMLQSSLSQSSASLNPSYSKPTFCLWWRNWKKWVILFFFTLIQVWLDFGINLSIFYCFIL